MKVPEYIPDFTWRLIVAFLSFTLCPGIIILYLYNRDLFMEVDFFKLIALALSISLPICCFNYILCVIAFRQPDFIQWSAKEQINFSLLPIIISTIPLLLLAAVRVLWNISSKTGFISILTIELLLFVIAIISNTKLKENKS